MPKTVKKHSGVCPFCGEDGFDLAMTLINNENRWI